MLLVEDDYACQILTKYFLKQLGYESLDIASSAPEAIEMLSVKFYDIIWMDIRLPMLNGLIATQIIRARFPVEKTPYIIGLTADALPHMRGKCVQAGMNDYVPKPFRKGDLKEAIALYTDRN